MESGRWCWVSDTEFSSTGQLTSCHFLADRKESLLLKRICSFFTASPLLILVLLLWLMLRDSILMAERGRALSIRMVIDWTLVVLSTLPCYALCKVWLSRSQPEQTTKHEIAVAGLHLIFCLTVIMSPLSPRSPPSPRSPLCMSLSPLTTVTTITSHHCRHHDHCHRSGGGDDMSRFQTNGTLIELYSRCTSGVPGYWFCDGDKRQWRWQPIHLALSFLSFFCSAYISHARTFEPTIPRELTQFVVGTYVQTRIAGRDQNAKRLLPTPRTLLSILRLSQALVCYVTFPLLLSEKPRQVRVWWSESTLLLSYTVQCDYCHRDTPGTAGGVHRNLFDVSIETFV
jgi:hypothetical protein